jgi:hypothetical protein
MDKKALSKLIQKWSLLIKVIPILVLVIALKVLCHTYGFEVITLNALYTSLVAGTIFLLGFLISGVLSDYKESEKIPTEMATSLESLRDDAYTAYKTKNSKAAKQFLDYHKSFFASLMDWFYKKERTQNILGKIRGMNDFFVDFEKEGVQANYIIRMKNEQNNMRRLVMRTHTIRDTEFVASAYAIVEALGIAITLGVILIKIEPFYEALFFTGLVAFLVSYMIFLIKDLDNPFDYATNGESGTEVSLKPLHDLEAAMKTA